MHSLILDKIAFAFIILLCFVQLQTSKSGTINTVPSCFVYSRWGKLNAHSRLGNMVLMRQGISGDKNPTMKDYSYGDVAMLYGIHSSKGFAPPGASLQSSRTEQIEAEEKDEDLDDSDMYFEGEFEGDEIVISTSQIRVLRKEADKRRVEKKLPTFFLAEEEESNFSLDTLQKINNLFVDNELVEVRSISKSNKKKVHKVVEQLSTEIESAQVESMVGRMVISIQIKGFSSTFYCPFMEDRPDRIQLRSSYRPNQWTRKLKPIRDKRGQIILGEDGKSIKE